MKEITGVSSETERLTKEYLRRLSIADSLPDPEQAMAEFELKQCNQILTAVTDRIKQEPVLVALQMGEWQVIDFRSGDTPITVEVVQSTRAVLNSSGYSLLVVKASRNMYKLFVAKHTALSRPQSRLLWVAPKMLRSIIMLVCKRTCEAALQKVRSGLIEDGDFHQGNRSYSNKFNSGRRVSSQPPGKAKSDRNWRNNTDDCDVFPIEALSLGNYAYTVPWALHRSADGTYWFHGGLICSRSNGGTAVMKVRRREEGIQVFLPKNLAGATIKELYRQGCFIHGAQQDFEWVKTEIRMPPC